jgi:hypothetical protein
MRRPLVTSKGARMLPARVHRPRRPSWPIVPLVADWGIAADDPVTPTYYGFGNGFGTLDPSVLEYAGVAAPVSTLRARPDGFLDVVFSLPGERKVGGANVILMEWSGFAVELLHNPAAKDYRTTNAALATAIVEAVGTISTVTLTPIEPEWPAVASVAGATILPANS